MSTSPKKKVDSRRKGRRGELMLAHYCEDFLGMERGDIELNYSQSTKGGQDFDTFLFDYAWEVKNWKRLTQTQLDKHWIQAEQQGKRVGKQPILAYKELRQPWRIRLWDYSWGHLIDMKLDDFLMHQMTNQVPYVP